jgi:hypothetical protein
VVTAAATKGKGRTQRQVPIFLLTEGSPEVSSPIVVLIIVVGVFPVNDYRKPL